MAGLLLEGLPLRRPCCCCLLELENKGWSGDAGVKVGHQVVVDGRNIPTTEKVGLCWWRRELDLQLFFRGRTTVGEREREL